MKTKGLLLVTAVFLFAVISCGVAKKESASHDSGQDASATIQNKFLGASFGQNESMVLFHLRQKRLSYKIHDGTSNKWPMSPTKQILCKNVYFGGYNWSAALFDLDSKSSFYRVTFYETFSNRVAADMRFYAIRSQLDSKYGSLAKLFDDDNSVCYAELSGRNVSVILSTHDNDVEPYSVGLQYFATEIYTKNNQSSLEDL